MEAGTLPTPNIIALGAGLTYVKKHFEPIEKKITALTERLLQGLKLLPAVKTYSHNPHSGVVSFEVVGLDSNYVVNELSQSYGICTRGGLHCAPLIHKHLHHNTGLVRVSLNHFNHTYEIKKLLQALVNIIAQNKDAISKALKK